MTAALLNLELDKGSTWKHTFKLNQGKSSVPMDLTGYTAKMQIRKSATSPTVLFELSTLNGRLIIEHPGVLKILVTDEDTGDMTFNSAVYDLEITSADGETTRIVQGTITATQQVTR